MIVVVQTLDCKKDVLLVWIVVVQNADNNMYNLSEEEWLKIILPKYPFKKEFLPTFLSFKREVQIAFLKYGRTGKFI